MEPQTVHEIITETLEQSGHNVPWAVRAAAVVEVLEQQGFKIVRRELSYGVSLD